MKITHIIEYVLFQTVGTVLRLLSLRTVQRLGATMGEKVFSLGKFRASVTLQNLRHAYPEKSNDELDRLARSTYRSFGTAFFEFMWFPRLKRSAIQRLVHLENVDIVRAAKKRGKGVILLTAHFGNWELLATATSLAADFPIHIIVQPQANPLVDREVNRWRTLFGNSVVPMEESVREILRTLHQGGAVGIVADQSAPMENISVNFFGRLVPTHTGPGVFALKTGAALLIGFSVRQPDGTYLARYEEITTTDLGGYSEESVAELTRRHVLRTEQVIRKYPNQWMWMHKRWKHAVSRESEAEEVSAS